MASREVSGAAIGWMTFAAVWMGILGFFHAIAGLSGILKDDLYLVTPNYLFQIDVTTWGWVHLILGIVVFLAAFSVLKGSVWARTVGVILAVLSTLATFAWLPYYPLWGILLITADVFVIWALTVHGRDAAAV